MIEFICLFFPAFISINIISHKDKKIDLENKIFKYFVYNILINLISLLIIGYMNSFKKLYITDLFTLTFSLKYLVLSSTIAILLTYIIFYIKRNFKIKIKRVKK